MPDLTLAFPPAVRMVAAAVVAALPAAAHGTSGHSVTATGIDGEWPGLVVGGAVVTIPMRLYHPVRPGYGFGSGPAGTIAGCLYTRHNDGYVRQWALRHVLPSAEPWVVPFVVQLLGEYVLGICLDIEAFVRETLPSSPPHRAAYAEFVRSNPAFLDLTAQRATSYWAEYHRGRYLDRDEYPALAALRVLAT